MKGENYLDKEIAKFLPDASGGYSQLEADVDQNGELHLYTGAMCSAAGMRQMQELRRIQRHWQPLLDAWHEHYGSYLCRHGVPLDEFSWCINDYCYQDAGEPAAHQMDTVFMLDDGFHGEDWCIAAEFTPRFLAFTWFHWGDAYVPQLAPELRP